MSEHHPKFFTKYFDGPFYDYAPEWYIDVGLKILQTLTINSVMPIVQLVVAFVVPTIKRGLDNGFTNDPRKTKSTSL